MLTAGAPPAEQADFAREMRASVGQMLKDLKRLPESVRKARAGLPRPQEPVSLDRLIESRGRATGHARRAAAVLLERPGSDDSAVSLALADLHELVEEVRTGLTSRSNLDDLGEMIAESGGHSGERALRLLDTRVRRIGMEADRMFALAVAAQQHLSTGAKPMTDHSSQATTPPAAATDATASAVREVGQIIAATLASASAATPPATPRSTDRRYAAVADQITASLQAYGLPHAGAQLPTTDAADAVRAQLIDGLQRNFASRHQDGTRTYYRTAPQPATRTGDEDARLLRGSALVNARLLRAEVDGVLAIVDRLPDMLRFVPSQPRLLATARTRLRDTAERLVATASDPLGLNPDRGRFQFQRLSGGVLEVLLSGEVLSRSVAEQQLDRLTDDRDVDPWASLSDRRGALYDDLRERTGAVRDEEVRDELVGLGKLMVSIRQRVSTPLSGVSRGIAAARLEELLTAADDAASALEGELERFGTSPAEQEVQFLRGTATSATAGGTPTAGISLAQFIAWVHGACEPFVGQENAAAAMLPEDLAILSQELGALSARAGEIATLSPVGFGGVWRQFDELRRFLDEAKQQADLLAR